MLKVQHIPLSVGNTVKMAAQSSLRPFQKHFLSIECSPLLVLNVAHRQQQQQQQ